MGSRHRLHPVTAMPGQHPAMQPQGLRAGQVLLQPNGQVPAVQPGAAPVLPGRGTGFSMQMPVEPVAAPPSAQLQQAWAAATSGALGGTTPTLLTGAREAKC